MLAVESSAVAAQLLDGGCTAHAAFKILISVPSGSRYNIDASSQIAENLKQTSLTIWNKTFNVSSSLLGGS